MIISKKNSWKEKIRPIIKSGVECIPQLQAKVDFLQITSEDLELIKHLQPFMEEHAEEITRRHYAILYEIEHLKKILDKHSTIDRLTKTFIQYLNSIPHTQLTEEYMQQRKVVGLVHSKINLAMEWYIGSFTRVYEYLTPVIISHYSRKPGMAADLLVALNKILTLDSLIVTEAYQETHEFQFVETNSEIIEEVIRVDKVKPLLESVDISLAESSNVVAAAEQLSASVHEIAEHTVHVSEQSAELIDRTKEDQQVIHQSLSGILQLSETFANTETMVQKLLEEINEVSGVVHFIREIAEQTNLLALNASIEAARAGEEGRGFAVVASEVRKLAEQTKSSVEKITTTIDNVQQNANQVGKQTLDMTKQLHGHVQIAEEAISCLDEIIEQVSVTADAMSNIAAIVQEQSASTHDISKRIGHVLVTTEEMQANALNIGQDIYDISIRINDLRKKSISFIPELKDSHFIRIVKTDHLLWKWWVYNNILGFHQIASTDELSVEKCRLGRWYQQMKNDPYLASLPAFQALQEPHQEIHTLAHKAYEYVQRNQKDQASQLLLEMDQASSKVIQILDQLEKEMV